VVILQGQGYLPWPGRAPRKRAAEPPPKKEGCIGRSRQTMNDYFVK